MRTLTQTALLLALLGCGPIHTRRPTQTPYPQARQEVVWQKALSVLHGDGYPLLFTEPRSGSVRTDWLDVPPLNLGPFSYSTQDQVSILVGASGTLTVTVLRRFRRCDLLDSSKCSPWSTIVRGSEALVGPVMQKQRALAKRILSSP